MRREVSAEAPQGEGRVDRIVVASLCTRPAGLYEQLESIRESATRHNPPAQVSAVLLAQSGWFVHWAEGPAPAIRSLIERVRLDPRHRTPFVLHHSRGPRILPSPWSMMLSTSTEPAAAFDRRVQALRERFDAGQQLVPTSVVRRLSAPYRMADTLRMDDPEAFYRFGLVTSGTEAFDFVRWLGQQHRAMVNTRRFAGEAGHDSGSDYADFVAEGQPCRVIALARQGLLHGLRQVFLADWHFLLLLFTGNPRRDDSLMDRIRVACAGLPVRPVLLGVAPDVATHERMARAAADDHLRYDNLGVVSTQDFAAVWYCVGELLRRAGPPPSSVWSTPEPLETIP